MKKFLIENGWIVWLGFSLPVFANIYMWDWQFYCISVPIIIAVCIRDLH